MIFIYFSSSFGHSFSFVVCFRLVQIGYFLTCFLIQNLSRTHNFSHFIRKIDLEMTRVHTSLPTKVKNTASARLVKARVKIKQILHNSVSLFTTVYSFRIFISVLWAISYGLRIFLYQRGTPAAGDLIFVRAVFRTHRN